jgi:hypothetical protein
MDFNVMFFLHGAKMAILENQNIDNHKDTIITILGGGQT